NQIWSVSMVELNHNLISQARRLTTGANVHQMKIYIFLYEQAVELHNSGHPRHAVYHEHYERLLNQSVRSAHSAWILCEEVRRRTDQAMNTWKRSEELRRELDELTAALSKGRIVHDTAG